MLLCELFTAPVPWSFESTRDDFIVANFSIGKIRYKLFTKRQYTRTENERLYKIEFVNTHGDVEDLSYERMYGITGTGNQYKVFATIIDVLQKFIEKYQPTGLMFTADEPNRKRLYLTLIKKLIPNWKLCTNGSKITLTDPNFTPQEAECDDDGEYNW